MFVDLVGSTALSSALDPEEMSELLRAYQNAVAGERGAFRWAHSQVPRRRGALLLRVATRARGRGGAGSPGGISDRRGGRPTRDPRALETGSTDRRRHGPGRGRRRHWRGRGSGGGRRRRDAQPRGAAAGPGAARTGNRRREYATISRWPVRGRGSRPVPVSGLRPTCAGVPRAGPGRAEGRFESLHPETLTPLVGREQELALLLGRWRQAKDGEGQVVLLSGEPGIGKSRIVLALRERLREEPCTTLRYQCSPYQTNTAFWPVARPAGASRRALYRRSLRRPS